VAVAMADLALAALVRAWQTTTFATMLLIAVVALSRIWDSAAYLMELPLAFQSAEYTAP
jgi:hypothetical protein